YATVAYLHVPGSGKLSPELDEDIVPVFPEPTRFRCVMSLGGRSMVKTVVRHQLPLIPAYAFTDYKSQGRSLTKAIVDIESARTLQGVYVMLSRVRTSRGLLILRPFSTSKLCSRLSQELRDELARIDRLDDITKARYEDASM
ncbi:hypothetical protein PYCCODRAFT_1379688, partial [Trametes coccinea BRFM310]